MKNYNKLISRPFQLNNITNPLVQCSDIPDIDLSPWKDATCAKM